MHYIIMWRTDENMTRAQGALNVCSLPGTRTHPRAYTRAEDRKSASAAHSVSISAPEMCDHETRDDTHELGRL